MFRTQLARTFLGIALFLAFLVLVDLVFDVLLYFSPYSLLGLLALSLLLRAAAPIARRRGWGSEGRLTRFLNRPRFVDESRRSDFTLQQMSGSGQEWPFRLKLKTDTLRLERSSFCEIV